MMFDGKKFVQVELRDAKMQFMVAPDGWYIELLNPEKNGSNPNPGGNQGTPTTLQIGKKVNVKGPCSFALWPGQRATLIQGHTLHSNEYLVAEVYDAQAARDNWEKATIEQIAPVGSDGESDAGDGALGKKKSGKEKPAEKAVEFASFSKVPDGLANGQRLIIKGTDVAFFIPPTGVKVRRDEGGQYVRGAVTLKNLEYAVLLDENGQQEYVYGPNVVFPKPTQEFIVSNTGEKKFSAYELDTLKGLHVKVIEKYKEGDTEYKVGDELFITDQVYMPRREHAIIKYGGREIHYAVAIPQGEGRYVLDRCTSNVELVLGPKMFLPDPRFQVMTRRRLTDKEVRLYYPGNEEARKFNEFLRQKVASAQASSDAEALSSLSLDSLDEDMSERDTRGAFAASAGTRRMAAREFGGAKFDRQETFTPPRTVVLDTKYDGVVIVRPWTNYAVKIVGKGNDNKGRVVVGPETMFLAYDETLEPMSLSSGKPKTTDKLIETVYLRVRGNKVGDIVSVETRDLVPCSIKLSYRVNFEGDDPNMWFEAENYVKFLCDHARSVLKSAVKKVFIAELKEKVTEIVRDAILGAKPEAAGTEREGMKFTENMMRIYDVEVLDLQVIDHEVQALLSEAQHSAVKNSLQLVIREREVQTAKAMQAFDSEELSAKRKYEQALHEASLARLNEQTALATGKEDAGRTIEAAKREFVQKLESASQAHQAMLATERQKLEVGLNAARLAAEKASVEEEQEIANGRREIKLADGDAEAKIRKALQDLDLAAHKAEVEAAVEIAKAFSPQLVTVLEQLTQTEVAKLVASNFSDLSILEGQSPMAIAARIINEFPRLKGLLPLVKEWTDRKNP